MRFKFTFFTCLLLSFHYSKAQKSFEPGYVVITPNDTLRGFIDYKSWSRNPETINFKSFPEQTTQTYGLADLESFNVHGESYIKAKVEVNISPTEIDKLSTSPVPEFAQTVAFLLVVRSGPKGLFYLKDKNSKVQLYISDRAGHYQLLVHHRYDKSGGSGQVVSVDHYREQLKSFFSDCEMALANQRVLPYSLTAVSKVFDRFYQKCSSEKTQTVAYKPARSLIQAGVVVGLSNSKLNFEGTYRSEITEGSFSRSTKASGGVFLNLLFPRLKQRFSIYNELAFTSYKSSIVKQTTYSDGSYMRSTNTLGFGYVKLINMARYHIPIGNSKLFLNGGITNGRSITKTNERITEDRFQTSAPLITKSLALDDTRKYEFGWIFGIGINYERFGIELRHESSEGMSIYYKLKSRVNREYLLLSYRFLDK